MEGLSNLQIILTSVALTAIPALICITIHELAHGYTAYRLGDNTARDLGRLTLNPLKHIDVIGLIAILFIQFGWAKAVPVNMYNFKYPKWYMAITAVAGPLSNIALAIVVLFIFGLLSATLSTTEPGTMALIIIQRTAYISVALAVFNMLPIPPLDGSKVLFSLLPDGAYRKLMRYEQFGFILLVVLLVISLRTNVFGNTVGVLRDTVFFFLMSVSDIAFDLVN